MANRPVVFRKPWTLQRVAAALMVLTGDYDAFSVFGHEHCWYIGHILIERHPDAVRVWPDIKDHAMRRQLHAIRKATDE